MEILLVLTLVLSQQSSPSPFEPCMRFVGTSHFLHCGAVYGKRHLLLFLLNDVTSLWGLLRRFPVIMSICASWWVLFAERCFLLRVRVSCLTPLGSAKSSEDLLWRASTSFFAAWHVFSISDALKDGDNEVVQAPISIVLTDIIQVMPEAVLKYF